MATFTELVDLARGERPPVAPAVLPHRVLCAKGEMLLKAAPPISSRANTPMLGKVDWTAGGRDRGGHTGIRLVHRALGLPGNNSGA